VVDHRYVYSLYISIHMRALDFLIYYTTSYFKQNSQLLSWSTALERACYATALTTTFWVFTFWQVVSHFALKTPINLNARIPIFFSCICFLLFYQYLYINRERYNYISSDRYKPFKFEGRIGIQITMIFTILSFILPFAISIFIGLTRHSR
jgi:hypothetical protein